jgi:hypothetical protein
MICLFSTPLSQKTKQTGSDLPLGFLEFEFSHIDGRPRFAKHSINDGKQVEIAAIDPDF